MDIFAIDRRNERTAKPRRYLMHYFIASVLDGPDVFGIARALAYFIAEHLSECARGFVDQRGHLSERGKIVFLDGHQSNAKQSHLLSPTKKAERESRNLRP